MTTIVKFPAGHRYVGYGYDTARDLVVSYKRDAAGRYLEKRTSYVFYYRTVYHDHIRTEANALFIKAKAAAQLAQRSAQGAANAFVAGALAQTRVDGLQNVRPAFPYVLYSVKNQCSQYFFANTSIAEALAMLAKRGEYVEPEDIRILNTTTEKVTRLTPQKVVTYTLG